MASTTKPLFTIIARTCRRPAGSERMIKSVLRQTCKDWEILFLVDKAGSHPEGNVLWANSQFYHNRQAPSGHYCLALDDDGVLPERDFLATVKQAILETDFPECVLVRSVTTKPGGGYHKLPSRKVWTLDWDAGERPDFWYGHGYNWVIRQDIFAAFVGAYCKPRGGDWYFMTALIEAGVDFVKCPTFGGKSISRGRGEKFEKGIPSDWFEKLAQKYGLVKTSDLEYRLYGSTA